MISYGKKDLGTVRRRPLTLPSGIFHKSEWMESGEAPGLAPTVFLAEQPPDCELQPHFHRQNQFQLFVDGTGRIGPQQIRPVTVHYAGAYTGYGPIFSGPEGLKYFTIRSAFDTGLIPATEAREKMVRGPKRHAQGFAGEPWSTGRLAALAGVQRETVLAPENGLGAELFHVPPQAAAAVPAIDHSPGRFLFVLSGSAFVGEVELQPWESAFVPATEGPARVRAGSQGADVIALHIPETAPEYAPR